MTRKVYRTHTFPVTHRGSTRRVITYPNQYSTCLPTPLLCSYKTHPPRPPSASNLYLTTFLHKPACYVPWGLPKTMTTRPRESAASPLLVSFCTLTTHLYHLPPEASLFCAMGTSKNTTTARPHGKASPPPSPKTMVGMEP